MSAILKKRAPLALAVALAIFCAASPLAERRETHAASSSVDKVVMAGDPAPGGGTFTDFNGAVSLSDGGQVAFRATLSTGSTGIFVVSSTASGYATSKVAMTGDANPAGGTFSSEFSSPSLNSVADTGSTHAPAAKPRSQLKRRLERRCSYDLKSSVPSTNIKKFFAHSPHALEAFTAGTYLLLSAPRKPVSTRRSQGLA